MAVCWHGAQERLEGLRHSEQKDGIFSRLGCSATSVHVWNDEYCEDEKYDLKGLRHSAQEDGISSPSELSGDEYACVGSSCVVGFVVSLVRGGVVYTCSRHRRFACGAKCTYARATESGADV
jgi:hypothetical protein